MRQNRIFRDEQYAERRKKDFEEALQREAELSRQLRKDYQRQAEMLQGQYQEIVQRKEAIRHQKHTDMCSEVVHQIVDLSQNVRC